ncbi:MAG: isoleucyl-tRNA synthetase [Woeseiaceae bacterium]|jgi:isoleucyl-tRNA synthetase|tara:strand:- start:2807 stop:5950 length:3144 start_codon:yes stop_codon:yes gene_type:complete
MKFKEIKTRYNGPALEEEVLTFWEKNTVFEKTLEQSNHRPLYTFNEGPPTANGKPGIHHVLARSFKDAFPRYKTMQGFHVPRKAGWDTHGLPVEHEIEKQLGIFDKKEIESKVGIAEFTKRCRESVMTYIKDWEKMTERMGFWVNTEDAYYTLDNKYIESVWHLLKNIWNKDLIYRGYKVVPYDPRIGATLSQHELAQGYRDVEDPSIFVRFALKDETNTSFLVWTTTPWTLPSNLMLAVHCDVDYVYIKIEDEILILAEELLVTVLQDRPYSILKRVKGKELIGKEYLRLFDYLDVPNEVNAFEVYEADFVSTENGTGIVHCAPAYGVDDLELGQKNGLPVIHGVGLDGNFINEVTPVAGLFFKDADEILINLLKKQGSMFRSEKYLHSYPFGWRTGDPIIYYAKHAWYIKTSKFRDRMVELNKTINWVPGHIRDGRFGKWLENNQDWALSRERFWGTPLPVWTDGENNYHCVGSVDELAELSGQKLTELDLHRPSIDDITFKKDGKLWTRVPEVIDCWFDSGAMSFAQYHFPFENEENFDQRFPVDFICEAIDQTRGWFYTLHAISTLVSDSVAYRNCICLSHIVDKDGKKMSKSLGNIINPYDVFDSVGADALRWHFLARISPDIQKRVSVEIISDVASSFMNTFWNTYGFFILYARLDNMDLKTPLNIKDRPETDRWVLALLNQTISKTTDAMDKYDAKLAGETIESFVDQLSNWYIRRNRRRFWKSSDLEDKRSAYLTLYQCLDVIHRLMAPFIPFLAENVYQNLIRYNQTDAPISVHMTTWPKIESDWENEELLFEINVVQKVVGLARAARAQSGVRVRQPLPRLLIRTPTDLTAKAIQNHQSQILEELNVKKIEFIARDAGLVSYVIKPNLPRIGKKYGKLIPAIKEALINSDTTDIASLVAKRQSFEVHCNEQILTFEPEDVLIETKSAEGYSCGEEGGYLTALDTRLDVELIKEGLAREIVRSVQEARKKSGLDVSDRIILGVSGSEIVETALKEHQDFLMTETLSVQWQVNMEAPLFSEDNNLDDETWLIELKKISE